jgi:hypothetical protein
MAGQSIERREVLRILALAAGAARFAGFTRWTFGCGHLRSAVAIAPSAYQPLFFTASEYALIERLTDIILPSDSTPGACEAGVVEFIDFMVSHETSLQYRFRTGIAWLTAHAERLHGKAFLALSPELQVALLEPLAYKAKERPGEEDGREFFRLAREFTVMGFYTSEIGFKELDHPALRFYTESPECPHKDDPEHRKLAVRTC